MIYKRKIKDTCYKCGSNELLKQDYPLDSMLCESCCKIKCYPFGHESKQQEYLWYHGIEDNGLEWYKKARGKLVINLDKVSHLADKKHQREQLLIKQSIDKW